MPSKAKRRLKSIAQLLATNGILGKRERDLVLGHQVDLSKFLDTLRSFLEDCQHKIEEDKRLGPKRKGELKDRILHWQLLDDELKRGRGSMLYQVPKKMATPTQAPLPDPAAPRAAIGYQSPVDTIREKAGWSPLLNPSTTRLFNLDALPCFEPASLAQKVTGGNDGSDPRQH